MRDDAGAHRIVEMEFVIGDVVAEVDVHRAGDSVGDRREAQVMRCDKADRTRRDRVRTTPSAPATRSAELVPENSSSSRNRTGGPLSREARSSKSRTFVTSAKNRDFPACRES